MLTDLIGVGRVAVAPPRSAFRDSFSIDPLSVYSGSPVAEAGTGILGDRRPRVGLDVSWGMDIDKLMPDAGKYHVTYERIHWC